MTRQWHVSVVVHQRAEAAGLPAEQIALQTRHRQIDVLIRHYTDPR